MDIITIENSASGTWHRDAELLAIKSHTGLELIVEKDSDNKKWRIVFNGIIAYKVTCEEFYVGILDQLPIDGGFFEIKDSPWIAEYGDYRSDILSERHHFVYCCYDEAIEVIAKDFTVTEVKDGEEQESLLTERNG